MNPIYPTLSWVEDAPYVEVLPGHAEARHGSDANAARTCSSNPNALKVYNPLNKRTGWICFLSDNRLGVHFIDDQGREVTAYVLNKVNSMGKALECLARAGFGLIQ